MNVCKAVGLAEKIEETLQEAIKERKRLSAQISSVEQAEQDILHAIEDGESKGISEQYSEAVYKLRVKRRELKNELQPLQYLIDSINPQRANVYINKVKEIYSKMNGKTVYNYETRQIHIGKNILTQVDEMLDRIS